MMDRPGHQPRSGLKLTKGRPPQAVSLARQAKAADTRRQRSAHKRERALALARQGWIVPAIAREVGMSRKCITRWAEEAGIVLTKGRPPRRRGMPTGKVIELTTRRYGELEVLGRASIEDDVRSQPRWICRCVCGVTVTVAGSSLRRGSRTACGRTRYSHPQLAARHPREYEAWNAMNRRGAVCDRWRSFAAFFADLGPRPASRMCLFRLDENRPFGPGNCAWSARQVQIARSVRKRTAFIEYQGQRLTVREWAQRMNLRPGRIHHRLWAGWSVKRALQTPADCRNLLAGLLEAGAELERRLAQSA